MRASRFTAAMLPFCLAGISFGAVGARDYQIGELMRWTASLFCFGMVLCSPAGVWAKPAYVIATVNLRMAPGTTNEIVAKIPGGSLVDADNCTAGWCAVTWQDKHGFAIQSVLDLSGHVPPRRAYGPPPGYVQEGPPVYYEYDAPPPPPPIYYGPYWRRHYRW
jgi:uncharacterized protein YraI